MPGCSRVNACTVGGLLLATRFSHRHAASREENGNKGCSGQHSSDKQLHHPTDEPRAPTLIKACGKVTDQINDKSKQKTEKNLRKSDTNKHNFGEKSKPVLTDTGTDFCLVDSLRLWRPCDGHQHFIVFDCAELPGGCREPLPFSSKYFSIIIWVASPMVLISSVYIQFGLIL